MGKPRVWEWCGVGFMGLKISIAQISLKNLEKEVLVFQFFSRKM